MTEQRLLFMDIETKSISSAPVDNRSEKRLWTRSDNTFRFNFVPDKSAAAPQEKTSPSGGVEAAAGSKISFTGQGSAFAFNFQIPPLPPEEDMETTETPDTSSSTGGQKCVQEEEIDAAAESSAQSKAKKKKKKSGKKNPSDSAEATQSSTEGGQGGEDTQLSAEEQLNRQLDWCIEQLELGMRNQKGTPKQKEEASRALKTLRSSKAPLAKKRQVMRAMNGDYRKKMDDEKSKQYKLIQTEIASAQVKVVSDSPKKSVFHRRADVKNQTPAATEKNLQQTEAQQDTELKAQAQEETAAFVFTPSKEEFRFNFL